MPAGLHRCYGAGDMHFITGSCFQRRPLLDNPARRTLFLEILEEVRQKHQFVIAAYVAMPEHFHLLVSEPEQGDLSLVMQVLKQRVARQALPGLRRSGVSIVDEEHFWQRRFMTSTCGARPSTLRRCTIFIRIQCGAGWWPSRSNGCGAAFGHTLIASVESCW